MTEFEKIALFFLVGMGSFCLRPTETTRLIVPQYIEVALKETLTFNISWTAEDYVTLSIARVIGALETKVLSINGTYTELLNNWTSKGVVEIRNGTNNLYHMTLSLSNIVFEDEGHYDVQVQTESTTETVFFILQTYALPIYLQMSSDSTNYPEFSDAAFTCTGNVGRPLGTLRLLRSSTPSSTDYFVVEESVSGKDLTELPDLISSLPNGTYYVSYTFHRNMTRQDNATIFMCDIVHYIPAISTTESNQVIVYVEFEGISMDISPPYIILNYPSTDQLAKTIFSCRNPTATDIADLSSLKITRLTSRETEGIPQAVVGIKESKGPVVPNIPDIQNRATAGGAIDKTNYNLASVSVEFNTVDLQCADVGQYFCELTYDDANLNTHTEESSMNFTAAALPSDITLTTKKNGFNIDGSQIFPAKMSVGQEIEFTCAGKIGHDPNTKLQWAKTGNTGNLIKFQPEAYPSIATETQDPAIPKTGQCTHERTATLKYNITNTDRTIGILQFQCYAEVTGLPGDTSYRANSTTTFYIQVEGGNVPDGGAQIGQVVNNASNAGAIAGGVIGAIVFIVIVVLLVYFLWYRRRGGGDTYKTREETDGSNPNLAPSAADMYATPSKERNDKAPKPKPRKGKGKELHYAELDIATNVPVYNPKRHPEKVEYAEVKFNNNSDYEHAV